MFIIIILLYFYFIILLFLLLFILFLIYYFIIIIIIIHSSFLMLRIFIILWLSLFRDGVISDCSVNEHVDVLQLVFLRDLQCSLE